MVETSLRRRRRGRQGARGIAALGLLTCLALASPRASAQGKDVTPPRRIDDGVAEYPAGALAERRSGTVVLKLTIDATGAVTEVSVLESSGEDLDAAAALAAKAFRFEPATRDGKPIAVRIRFPYRFELPPPPPASEPSLPAARAPTAARNPDPHRTPASPAQTAAPLAEGAAVNVEDDPRSAEARVRSAEAVYVIDTARAARQSADLGEVMARAPGVVVRREGGLGSGVRFALNGLYDDQVRFFVDGVPLDYAGYPMGVANVPVSLVRRIELYRGVVPVRFGTDALGGAVNLVTDDTFDDHYAASWQTGSFGTQRLTLAGRKLFPSSGFVIGADASLDASLNRYEVDVEVPDDRGRLSSARVPRFHDAYRAYGTSVEAGFVDRSWTRRMTLRAFHSGYEKELQSNVVMTVPYGEAAYGERQRGAVLRFDRDFGRHTEFQSFVTYAHRELWFRDTSEWVYDWFGTRVRPRVRPGEITDRPSDQLNFQHAVAGRALLSHRVNDALALRASVAPAFTTRTGDERRQTDPSARDPLNDRRHLTTTVTGLEVEWRGFARRLEVVGFGKHYFYAARAKDLRPGGVEIARDRDSSTWGAGGGLRWAPTETLALKASYEHATRLPRPDEVFGNGVLIVPNLGLEPELSHNLNAGPRFDLKSRALGHLVVDANAFLRDSDRLIVLLGTDRLQSFQNVYRARSLGADLSAIWTAPRAWLSVDASLSYIDQRNASTHGSFGAFEGDRIPSRPWLWASWGARLRFTGTPRADDSVEPFYTGRFVEEFFRGWESQGLRAFKQVVDDQLTHGAGVSWVVHGRDLTVTSTLEVQNLTDARVFDNYGMQKPGRAYYVKFTGSY